MHFSLPTVILISRKDRGDLHVYNATEKTDTMIHQLQALGFAVQELGEYLDTHGEDAILRRTLSEGLWNAFMTVR